MSLTAITLLAVILKETSSNFRCKSQDSDESGTTVGDTVSVICPSSHPIMVSCGSRMVYSADDGDGSWMSNNGTVCTAQNGDRGVYAVARYDCNLIFVTKHLNTEIFSSTL